MIDIDIDAVFPTVRDIFITLHFKSVSATRSTRIGDEHWWEKEPLSGDLDVVLARHFNTPDATRRPLLLLGHPGAGKSLLTKVLAAPCGGGPHGCCGSGLRLAPATRAGR